MKKFILAALLLFGLSLSAQTAKVSGLVINTPADTGSANAYAVCPSPAIPALNKNLIVSFTTSNANTGASTVNVCSKGIKNLTKDGTSSLTQGDIVSGQIYAIMYDGTEWQLLNPSSLVTASANFTSGQQVIAAASNRTTASKAFEFQFIITGSGTAGVMQDSDDQPTIWANHSGRTMTITQVWCETNSATALTMQLQRDDGSPVNMLSANLSCSSTEANTTSFVSGENAIADSSKIDYLTVSAGGGANWVSVHFTVTY